LMYDDTSEGVLKVFIRDLTAADEGTYRLIRREGESVEIKCPYDENHTKEIKLLCKGKYQLNICVRDGVHVSSNNRTNGRFSLTEETSAGVFTVKISNLRAEDSGKYWCAEESSGSFIFTEVQLHVTGGEFWVLHIH
uniref:Immunoglobulin domain-containing protein n=1 Tax=Sinocyclocheilus grahami TaxID=75366 RepID=A0A672K9J3_SINGR